MCGNLAEGGAAERRARRESRLTARNTARAAATATECTVKARCERVAQVAAVPPSKRSPGSSRASESPGCMTCLSMVCADLPQPLNFVKPAGKKESPAAEAAMPYPPW